MEEHILSLVHDANATLKIEVGGVGGDLNSPSKLRSILKITYTIANFGGWRALGMTSRSISPPLALISRKQEIGTSQAFSEPQVFTSWQDTILVRDCIRQPLVRHRNNHCQFFFSWLKVSHVPVISIPPSAGQTNTTP